MGACTWQDPERVALFDFVQVCLSRKVNVTLVPCGHHCCCMPCTEKFELCPVCRLRITQKIKTIDG